MKKITMILGSAPYSGQDVGTVLGIAEAAFRRRRRHSENDTPKGKHRSETREMN
jgi:hypothetical protein